MKNTRLNGEDINLKKQRNCTAILERWSQCTGAVILPNTTEFLVNSSNILPISHTLLFILTFDYLIKSHKIK